MISGILIFNQKGENLIFRAFRNDCRPRLADVFRIQVISNAQVRSPILTLGSTTFSHVKHENIYLVAVTKSNANAALVFEFLYRLVALGKGYFGKFDEEAVKNNFVLVYELLDEILDFGYPQNTETDTLKMYITTEGVKTERTMEDSSKITMQATGALSWRRADIKYRKNEAFVDVIEDVNLLMSATGTVLRADVNGQIVMRAYLSGTPECKFGLNDRLLLDGDSLAGPIGNTAGTKATKAAAGSVTLEDCQFHQCVKLGKFDADRIISFIPPDGEFELMRYRATENVNLPFKVHAIVNELGKTKVEYSIAIKANYGSKLFATNVVVRVPTPLNTAKITERTSQGKAKYEPEHNNIVWKIPRFSGQSEYVLSAEASLTSMTNQKAWSRPPLSLSFSLLMFTSSGLLVRYLKVFEKSNYGSVKWVRYMTRAGSYEIRSMKRKELDTSEVSKMASKRRSRSSIEPPKPNAKSLKQNPASKASTYTAGSSALGTTSPDVGRRKEMDTETVIVAPEAFPVFRSGRVVIHLCDNPKSEFQLHRAVLERDSSWFAREFAKPSIVKDGTSHRFTLTQLPEHNLPFLMQTGSSYDMKPAIVQEHVLSGNGPKTVLANKTSQMSTKAFPASAISQEPKKESPNTSTIFDLTSVDHSKKEPSLKLEPQPPAVQTKRAENAATGLAIKPTTSPIDDGNSMEQNQGYQQYIVAHESLLGMYYSKAPKISTADIECALDQCERIIVLARHYGSLPIVQPYLGNHFSQYHRQLYTAIAKDPPRWLRLAEALESNSIFREAMIHCAGCYPYSPWITNIKTLPSNLISIVKVKADWLARLRTETTVELFMNTLKEIKGGPDVSLKTSPEAWIAVHIFHDWLGTQARQLRNTNKLHYGHHYRLMRKGGDAYLPAEKVRTLLIDIELQGTMFADSWDDLETDLNILKEYAKEVVVQITMDNLMVGAECMELPYLTCVDVGEEDYPWTVGQGSKLE
ncbi:hypothetical protein MMC17_006533 [Xylographa soralifera]|nr:hypothetical protein [Xylographa soralifera]